MRYSIHHTTTYTYDRPVTLAPHTIRLRPRSDVTQALYSFTLSIEPETTRLTESVDLDGNSIFQAYFSNQPMTTFTVHATSEVETFRVNPFDYLLELWAAHLPIDYPASLWSQLQPYLASPSSNFPSLDPVAVELAHDLWHQVSGNPVTFLWELNQRIHARCRYQVRETGDPMPPGVTWKQEAGSCRDLSVLFMEVCRAIGLAARFVSGYQEGDPGTELYLHGWAEVYLPGAGWRGYDPTQGGAVGDRHIALVASPISRHAAPVSGSLKTGVGAIAQMNHKLTIERLNEPQNT